MCRQRAPARSRPSPRNNTATGAMTPEQTIPTTIGVVTLAIASSACRSTSTTTSLLGGRQGIVETGVPLPPRRSGNPAEPQFSAVCLGSLHTLALHGEAAYL